MGLADRRLTAVDLNDHGEATPGQRDALQLLVDELDETAWATRARQHAGIATDEEYLRDFRKARAASAMWFALDPDPLTAAIQSAYEAYHAVADSAVLLDVVGQAFR